MGLIDDLREIGKDFPPSHVPSVAEAPGVLAGLVAYVEHGPALFEAAKTDIQTLSDLLGGQVKEAADTVADDFVSDKDKEIAELRSQLASALGAANLTTAGDTTSTATPPPDLTATPPAPGSDVAPQAAASSSS
jgi:hypothetical protein